MRSVTQYRVVLGVLAGATLFFSSCTHDFPRPQEGVAVLHYDVELALQERTFTGHTLVHVAATPAKEEFRFHVGSLTIDSIRHDGIRVHGRRSRHEVAVTLPGNLETATVEFFYRGKYGRGLFRKRHSGGEIVYTDGWPYHAMNWLPGVHHPSRAATIDLRLHVEGEVVVATSGRPVHHSQPADGHQIYRFLLEEPAPTYAYGFAVGNLIRSIRDGVVVYAPGGDSGYRVPAGTIISAVRFFEDLLESPVPYGMPDVLVLPMRHAGMEHAGLVTVHPEHVAGEAGMRLVAHEVAHQWFGNRASVRSWADLWLSESIAAYLAQRFMESTGSDAAIVRNRWEQSDPRPVVPPSETNPEQLLGPGVYQDGPAVLVRLEDEIGVAALDDGLRCLYRTGRDEGMSTRLFRECLQEASDRDLANFFNTNVYQVPEDSVHAP
jgi:aminopeptidase N